MNDMFFWISYSFYGYKVEGENFMVSLTSSFTV